MKYLLAAFVLVCFGCQEAKNNEQETVGEPVAIETVPVPSYKSIAYIDSFVARHREGLSRNSALRKRYEETWTKSMRPLIDKGGLYDDIPFELFTTTVHSGKNYGNFIFDDGRHFIKVQCIIEDSQLSELNEKETYYIKFKTHSFQDGVIFKEDLSGVDLPTVNAYLQSFEAGMRN